MIKSLVFCKIYLTAVRTLPKEKRSVTHLVLEFGILRNIDTSIYCYFVLLAAFAAWGERFVDY
jgi:hypothetical protein